MTALDKYVEHCLERVNKSIKNNGGVVDTINAMNCFGALESMFNALYIVSVCGDENLTCDDMEDLVYLYETKLVDYTDQETRAVIKDSWDEFMMRKTDEEV